MSKVDFSDCIQQSNFCSLVILLLLGTIPMYISAKKRIDSNHRQCIQFIDCLKDEINEGKNTDEAAKWCSNYISEIYNYSIDE